MVKSIAIKRFYESLTKQVIEVYVCICENLYFLFLLTNHLFIIDIIDGVSMNVAIFHRIN